MVPELEVVETVESVIVEGGRHRGSGVENCTSQKLAPMPTDALPGSREKILVLMERAAQGYQLYHPLDASGRE